MKEELKMLKRNRRFVGSWFLGSWISMIICIFHIGTILVENPIFTDVQVIFITLYIANNILSTIWLIDVNCMIKKIQGHV